MANEISIREDEESSTDTAAPWDTVSFPTLARPTVTDSTGRERELTDYEFRKYNESREDTEMRREAAAAQRGTSTIDAQMSARPRPVKPLDDNTIYAFQLSPSIHEERVLSLTIEGDDARGYLSDAANFLRTTRETLTKIDTAYRELMLDKSMTPDARSIKLEAATSKAFTAAYTAHAATIDALANRIEHTEGLLSAPLEAKAATARSNELRVVLRQMKADERNEVIRAAINVETPSAQQRELLQSVLGAPALVVGINEQEQALHIRKYNERTQPQIVRRLDLLKKTAAIIEGLKPETVRTQYEGAMRSPFMRASNIRGISDKAAAALAAINGV